MSKLLEELKAKKADLEIKCAALQSEVAFFGRENQRLAAEAVEFEKVPLLRLCCPLYPCLLCGWLRTVSY